MLGGRCLYGESRGLAINKGAISSTTKEEKMHNGDYKCAQSVGDEVT
jgi:hypothetical protein